MCGIFGTVNTNQEKFKILGMLNEFRGTDSWGIYDGTTITKGTGAFSSSLITPNKIRWRSRMLLGHTRDSTRGAVSERNAHPFRYGNIIGAHNGVVVNFDELMIETTVRYPEDEAMIQSMQVDSEILIYLLYKEGAQGLTHAAGMVSLWWYNTQEKALYLYSDSGTLFYVNIGNSLAFSSDFSHIKGSFGSKLSPMRVDMERVYKIDLSTHLCRKNPTVEPLDKVCTKPAYSLFRGGMNAADDSWYASNLNNIYHPKGVGVYNPPSKEPPLLTSGRDGCDTLLSMDRERNSREQSRSSEYGTGTQPSYLGSVIRKNGPEVLRCIKALRKLTPEVANEVSQTLEYISGIPVITMYCPICDIELPWSSVLNQKEDRGICPKCRHLVIKEYASWCPSCSKLLNITDTDYVQKMDDATGLEYTVQVCEYCREQATDLFDGMSPIIVSVIDTEDMAMEDVPDEMAAHSQD